MKANVNEGNPTTRAPRPHPARGYALAAALALLAILGTASGFWSVAHHAIDHVHTHNDAHQHESAPNSDDTPPTDHDCPTCDLIAGSQTLTLTHAPSAPFAAVPGALLQPRFHAPPLLQVDLTTWSARPPPRVG